MPEQPVPIRKQELKCNSCGKVMQSRNELQEHQRTMHKGEQHSSGTDSTSQARGGQSGS